MRNFDADKIMTYEYYDISGAFKTNNRMINDSILFRWGKLWESNIIQNFCKYGPSVPSVTELFNTKDGAAIVCGGGPSLRENIAAVRDNGAFVIATDRALGTLLEAGIKPGLIISTDSNDIILDLLDGITADDTVCFMWAQSPKVFDLVAERGAKMYCYMQTIPGSKMMMKVFYGKHKRISADMKKYFGLKADVTVTSCGIDLAYWMGFSTIFTIGNELSWKSFEEANKQWNEKQLYTVELADGTQRWTILPFYVAAKASAWWPQKYSDADFIDMSDGIMQGWATIAL